MADVTIQYKGNTVAEMSSEGSKTLKTSGKYCEGDIVVDYIPPVDTPEVYSKVFNITLDKGSGWVKLIDLDSEILAHINDLSFTVSLAIKSDYEYVYYSGSSFMASNMPIGKINSYYVYGYANRQVSETSMSNAPIYYPPNKTDTSEGLGGNGIFRVDGNAYYLKPGDGFIRGGNYQLVFAW